MTTTIADPEPPYLVEMDGAAYGRSQYLSISFHPSKQNMSHEELRLEHYNAGHDNSTPTRRFCDKIRLMATRQVPGPITTQPRRLIRAVADNTHELHSDVIVFLVGAHEPKRFIVHERLVNPRSEFVRLALRGDWKEAQERTIKLPEDDPEVFSVYQQWLYDGLIHTGSDTLFPQNDDEYEALVKAYILGEKLMDPEFKDSITDAIKDKFRCLSRLDTGLTTLVFNETPSGSPLRRLWMDIYYHFGSPGWLDEHPEGPPVDAGFMVEFSRYQMQVRAGVGSFGRLAMFSSCTYHEHGIRMCHRRRMHNVFGTVKFSN